MRCKPSYTLYLEHLILAPVVAGLIRGSMDAFPGAVNSDVLRIMVASLWGGVLVVSAIALISPVQFWPVLVFQVIYKSIFVLLWVWPAVVRPIDGAIPWGPTGIFMFIIIVWPMFIAAALVAGGQSGQS